MSSGLEKSMRISFAYINFHKADGFRNANEMDPRTADVSRQDPHVNAGF